VALSKQRIGQGQRIADVITQERLHMAVLVRTQVADAGRMAQQAAIAATPRARGYIRVVHLPACTRCIILAGRFYRYSDGFFRHPNCDCTMDPVAVGSGFVTGADPRELLEQMRASHPQYLRKSMSEGDLKALEHGADLNQVINAHRGMTTAAGPGRQVQVTTEGTTKRGFAGQRLIREAGAKRGTGRYSTARTPRLTPAQVFEEASLGSWSRDEVVRQLKRFGYIT
jgi:DNA-binding phage protein